MLIDLSRVRVSGPLSAFATGFADHMTRQGYSPQQARFHLLLLSHLNNWLVSEGLDVGELRAKEVEQFQLSRHEAGDRILRSIRAMHTGRLAVSQMNRNRQVHVVGRRDTKVP